MAAHVFHDLSWDNVTLTYQDSTQVKIAPYN